MNSAIFQKFSHSASQKTISSKHIKHKTFARFLQNYFKNNMIKTLNNKKKNKMFKSSIKTSMNKEELLVTRLKI